MLKKFIFISLLVHICIFNIYAAEKSPETASLEYKIRESADIISQAVVERYPEMNIKKGLIILDFSEESSLARKNKMGTLVKVYLEEILSNSIVVYLVDRKNLDSIQEEYALALSGLVDEYSAPEIGSMKGAQLLLYGSIVEENSDFRISISLTETETAEVLMTTAFTIPNQDMVKASEELQYEYVAQNGIGLSAATISYIFPADDDFNENTPKFVDLKAKYRLSRNFMFSAGAMVLMPTGFYRLDDDENSYTYSDYQPDLGVLDNTVGQATNDFSEGMILHLDFQYTFNVNPKLNIGLNLGILGCPYLKTEYDISSNDGLRVKDYDYETDTFTITKDRTPITLNFSSFYGAKIEICPELFLTPRLALTGVAGYMITSETTVRSAYGTYADWDFGDEGIASNYNDFADDLYFGFDPSTMPNGDPWSLSFTGFYSSLSFTLFF